MSAERLNRLLEAADELETYLQAALDEHQRHGITLPAEQYDESRERRLTHLVGAIHEVAKYLQADLQQKGSHG